MRRNYSRPVRLFLTGYLSKLINQIKFNIKKRCAGVEVILPKRTPLDLADFTIATLMSCAKSQHHSFIDSADQSLQPRRRLRTLHSVQTIRTQLNQTSQRQDTFRCNRQLIESAFVEWNTDAYVVIGLHCDNM